MALPNDNAKQRHKAVVSRKVTSSSSSRTASKKTGQRQTKKQQSQLRTNAKSARATSSASKARGGTSGTGSRGSNPTTSASTIGRTASRGAVVEGGRNKVAGGGAKAIKMLRIELENAVESEISSAEKECDTMVTTALKGCSAGMSGREEDNETAETVGRDMESKQASAAARCSAMLKALQSNEHALSGISKRSKGTLDNLFQAESRKLKTSLERATGAKT